MGHSMGGEEQEASEEYVDDHCIETLGKIEHVESAQPVYQMSVLLLKGSYEGYTELLAMTPEGLKSRKIDLEEGQLPESNRGQLELVYGNQLLTNFTEKGSGNGYWDTGELPDIDLAKDSLFLILDMDNYHSSQERSPLDAGSSEEGAEGGETSAKPIQVQKHVVKASGVVAGGIDGYNANSNYAFCDLETLKQLLKKEFSGRAIPGQPQTKNGKPMNKFCYTYAEVKVDEADHVTTVSNQIKEMGYQVETNAELMDSMKRQMAIIQAVLGGIGAVSLFVAAIGIANTMMMSIYERTKEIGVMKVLGCSLKNIRKMFLMEAGLIGLFGGVIGNILSFLISAAINTLASECRSYEWNGADLLYSDLADAGIYRICDVGRTSCRIFSGEESDEIKSAGSDQALENCCQRENRNEKTRRKEDKVQFYVTNCILSPFLLYIMIFLTIILRSHGFPDNQNQ